MLGEYQYNDDLATWIVEAPEPTWERAKAEVEDLAEPDLLAYMERLWADYLDGHIRWSPTARSGASFRPSDARTGRSATWC